MVDLKGRVALVTGAAMGLGSAISSELARCGAAVALVDIDVVKATELARELGRQGYRAAAVQADVTNAGSIAAAVRAVEESLGAIAILVNNAGVVSFKPLLDLAEEEWDRVLSVNLKGTFLVTKAVIAGMAQRRYGRIVNMGSVVSKLGGPFIPHYTASKFGILGFTQSVALEFAQHGITANTVCPGIVMTPLHDQVVAEMAGAGSKTVEQALSDFQSLVPQKRPQTPLDIARMVAYLASDYAENMTGGSYHVDGGMVMC